MTCRVHSIERVQSRKLGSGIIGNPITYKVGGKQYISASIPALAAGSAFRLPPVWT
jgi:hypothetical protein